MSAVKDVKAVAQIGTHSGSFHCDEALACFMLRVLAPQAKIVRSRDPAVLNELPLLVDVGAVYDPANGRYDHHQKGFTETFDDKHKIKLSSAGLIYKHYGREVIAELTKASAEEVELIFQKVYDSFVEALDGIDNGVSQYPTDIAPAYSSNTDLASRVGRLNPGWNESGIDLQERFERAIALAGSEFVDAVKFVHKSWLPARQIVKEAMEKRFEEHESGEIVVMHNYTIWKNHLLKLEEELKVATPIKYVLYADDSKQWRVQAVPVRTDSFESRKPLPEAWCGLRDDVLSKESGIPDCVFVHASGFIGGNKTLEGAKAMAVAALSMPSPAKKQKTSA